jgi:hypothetical protein
LIEITDDGLGIAAEELAYANWRLDNPPVIDVGVSRRMGLFVVGRLAARHGVRVRLRQVTRGGLSALIWLPGPVAAFESAPPLAGLRRRTESRGFHPFFRPGRRSAATAATPAPGAMAATGATTAMAVQASPAREPSPSAQPVSASPQDPPAELPRTTQSGLPIRQAQPVAQARPAGAALPVRPTAGAQSAEAAEQEDTAPGVEVPETTGARLPIYDSVESDWFRHSGKLILPRQPSASSWTSPADEGFRAAQAAVSPTTGAATAAGLPKRVPSANLIPGSVGGKSRGSLDSPDGREGSLDGRDGREAAQLAGVGSTTSSWPASQEAAPQSPPPAVSVPRRPEQVRSRLAGLQRGARRGRTDAPWNFGADES